MQALVRLALDVARRDRAAGLRTGVLVTGYPGSPISGLDLALAREAELAERHGVRLAPAASEERAATALMGSQMLDGFPHDRYDGVVGFWYGKGPGIDRSGDALKHGNFAGTSTHGAVVVLSGEDHEAKSSTMPFQEDYAFVSAGIPVLYPSSVEEFRTLGLHAVAMSRYSGCWVALKLVTALCDGGQSLQLVTDDPAIVLPELEIGGQPFAKRTDFTFFPGRNIDHERHLYRERHAAVLAYARANQLDQIVVRDTGPGGGRSFDRVGLVAAGKSYADLRQALTDMGVSDETLRAHGIRLLKLALTYPLDPEIVTEFAAGLDEIVVVEEKRGVVESQVKEVLCGLAHPVRVLGKHDEHGAPLFPVEGGMDADRIAEVLGPRLAGWLAMSKPATSNGIGIGTRLGQIEGVRARRYQAIVRRTPNYCSGCPHSHSTRLPEGEIAWGSPGCHSFASVMEQPERRVEAMTQYGGEGLPWIGLAPFTDKPHMFQNVGDGSLWHSSYDNIRACVAAGVNITFKLLYNGTVANTGAQAAPGARSVPELARLLALEGVARIALVTKEPGRYRKLGLPSPVGVYPAKDVVAVQRELAAVPGVTVMLYDESCANERRRQQKRGKLERPSRYVLINERVCENCGDCGRVSNCMSLQKVDTEFGPKTQIHTSTCNQDYTCLQGDCPSFVTVDVAPGSGYTRRKTPGLDHDSLPEPDPERVAPLAAPYRIYSPGVGGTGVLTANAILAVAATLDGLEVASFDQTGAAQKWGPVLSSLIVAPAGTALPASKVGLGQADVLLGLDLVATVSPENLDRADPERTAAVVNATLFPTGEMVRDVWAVPDVDGMLAMLARHTRPDRTLAVPARELAEALFGDFMMTNMVVLGAAWQAGLLPISAASIEQAITMNGVGVEANLQAFRHGRAWVADQDTIRRAAAPAPNPAGTPEEIALAALSKGGRAAVERLRDRAATAGLDETSRELLATRLADLADYQSPAYAGRYLDAVLAADARERAVDPERHEITHAVIRNLYKLLAYKDEYEVARLYLQPAFDASMRTTFANPRQVRYQLHPPLLRALGLDRKLSLRPAVARPAFRALRALRRLRGTPFDLFGYAKLRRTERELIGWYQDLVTRSLERLRPHNHDLVVALANLPDRIRGYEHIKLASAAATKTEAERLLDQLERRRLPLLGSSEAS